MSRIGKHIAVIAALAFGIVPFAARAEDIPQNLKGSGEVIFGSIGGSLEAAQKKAFFEPFTRDTGIKVVLVPEDPAKLLASVKLGQPEYDVADVAGGQLATWVDKDFLDKIDYNYFRKDTLAGIPKILITDFGVGNYTYSSVIAYNTNKYPEDGKHPKNWADFYNIKDFPGKRGLSKCEKILEGGLLEGALLGDGVQSDKLYPLDMDRAFEKIKELKPNVGRWMVAGGDGPQGLIDGEIDVASSYNGRIVAAKKEGAPVALSWDQSLVQYGYWSIPKNSPNKDNAQKLIAYMALPERQAEFAIAMSYGPVNGDAFKFIPKTLADELPGSPELVKGQIFQDYQWWGAKTSDGRTNYDVALERCVALLSQ